MEVLVVLPKEASTPLPENALRFLSGEAEEVRRPHLRRSRATAFLAELAILGMAAVATRPERGVTVVEVEVAVPTLR
jgi:hypothetical protein